MTKILIIATLLILPQFVLSQTGDRRITEIRETCERLSVRSADAEKDFEHTDIFLTELVVNKGGTMYPAVGNFKETLRFYYTYGNREVSPYPNRLLKVATSTERSSIKESAEYCFNRAGEFIFAYENDGETENRYYFAAGKLIRWQKGTKVLATTPRARSEAAVVVARKERLLKIFRASLE